MHYKRQKCSREYRDQTTHDRTYSMQQNNTRHYKLQFHPKQPGSNQPYIKAYRVTIVTISQTQQTIAQSSAEAELYAIGTTVNDVIYVRNFLQKHKFTTDNRLIPRIYTQLKRKMH
eukprot:1944232-Amphidinium_carterae.1